MARVLTIPQTTPTNVLLNVGTGLVSGGMLSLSLNSNLHFNVAGGVGYVVDTYTDPENPTGVRVEWEPKLEVLIEPDKLTTDAFTRLGIDRDGILHQFTDTESSSPEISRDFIMIGSILHLNNTFLTGVSNTNPGGLAVANPLSTSDLATSIGTIIRNGCIYSAANGNLRLSLTGGEMFFFGINQKTNPKNPNVQTITEQNPVTFRYVWRNGSGDFTIGAARQDIDPNSYDNGLGGVSEPLGDVNNNRWTIQRVYLAPTAGTFIHYGQKIYQNLVDATLGILTEKFQPFPSLDTAPFRAWLLVKQGATNLSNEDQAVFISASKFGDIIDHKEN